MAAPANLIADGADPRLAEKQYQLDNDVGEAELRTPHDDHGEVLRPQQRRLHDKAVTFEEYHYYAKQTRLEEAALPVTGYETSFWSLIFPSKSTSGVTQEPDEAKRNLSVQETRAHISDQEWANASRALRTATRGAAFYLITTDILGPFGLPYAFATMGWG
jgi:hypothetical protein